MQAASLFNRQTLSITLWQEGEPSVGIDRRDERIERARLEEGLTQGRLVCHLGELVVIVMKGAHGPDIAIEHLFGTDALPFAQGVFLGGIEQETLGPEFNAQ